MTKHKAVRWANYPGDVSYVVGYPMGPTHTHPDDYVTVVEATYDPEKNTTRLGFAYGIINLTLEKEEEIDDSI